MRQSLKSITLKNITEIQEARNNNKLIIFVGAGVSQNSGLPSWTDLVKSLAQDIGIEKKLDVDGINLSPNIIQQLNDKNSQFSADEYLKIPQYYFNKKKRKEYFNKVKNLLSKKANPNIINYLICELKPKHIITTNYDDLLEQTYKKLQEPFSKISENKDLSTSHNNNFIIKMHGEITSKNPKFVLKEADYDNYSKDFKLIETYVKGLIATNTILFIGFSADDINVRKIFQWVKDILGDKIRPAFLINTDNYKGKRIQLIKHNYLKKIGIETLYYQEIKEDIEKFKKNNIDYDIYLKNAKDELNQTEDLKEKGQSLFDILYYIFYKNSSYIDECYEKLKNLECFSYIPNFILNKIFKCNIRQILATPSIFNLPTNKKIRKGVDDLRLKMSLIYDNLKYDKIKNLYTNNTLLDLLLDKPLESPIQIKEKLKGKINILDIEKNKIDYILKRININFDEQQLKYLLMSYNYLEISKELNSVHVIKYSNNVNIFKNSFLYFRLGEYNKSFDELKKISSFAFNNKLYILYILAEFNKNNLSNFMLNSKHKKEDINSLIDKLISPNIKEIIKEIVNFNYLTNFENKIFKFNEKIQDIYTKTQKRYLGGDLSNSIKKAIEAKEEIYNFMLYNFLIIDDYLDIKTIFRKVNECLINSYETSIEKHKQFEESKDYYSSDSIKNFIYEDFYYMIEYSDSSNIKEFPNNLILKDKEEYNKLIKSFHNIINYFTENKIEIIDIFNNKINNFLILFSKIDLTEEVSNNILNATLKLLEKYNNIPFYEQINYFLINNFNKNHTKFDCELLENLISLIINNSYKFSYFKYHYYLIEGLINNINSLMLNSNIKYKLRKETLLLNKIRNIGDSYIKLLFIISIYSFLTDTKYIYNDLQDVIKHLKKTDINQYIHFLYKLLDLRIIDISGNELLDLIEQKLVFNEETKTYSINFNIELLDLLHIVNFLIVNNKLDIKFVKHLNNDLKEYRKNYFDIIVDISFKRYFDMFYNLILLNYGLIKIDYTTLNILDLIYVKKERINDIKAHISKNSKDKKIIIKNILEQYKKITKDKNIPKHIIDRINKIIINIL